MEQLAYILLSWLLALLVWTPIGLWCIQKLDAELDERPIHSFILATVVGAALNAAALAVLSFWFPITPYISLLYAAFSFLLFRRVFRTAIGSVLSSCENWPIMSFIGISFFIAITLAITAHTSLNNDSGLYYIQFMKWINSYPVVPGLANLHDRLGFNSHWHLLNAAFNMNPFGRNTNDLNGLLFILIGIGSFDSASRLTKGITLFDLTWTILPLHFYLLLRFLTSTTPDLPATLIPFLCFSILIYRKTRSSLPTLTILVVFATTIKVLSLFSCIALLPLGFNSLKRKDWKPAYLSTVLGLLLLAPWLGRNIIQTGYLIFPMESVDIFHLDWKVPNELTANTRKMVDIHARFGNYDISNYGKPMREWMPNWINTQSQSVLMMLLFTSICSVLILGISLFRWTRNKSSETAMLNIFIALTAITSLLFWWKSGPNPRFVYGVLFFLFAYASSIVASYLGLGKYLRHIPLLALIPMLVISKTILNEKGPTKPTEFLTIKNTNGTIFYPTYSDKCWEHELPCTNMDRRDIKMRGNQLREGFANSTVQP